jgi:hypothetical protein
LSFKIALDKELRRNANNLNIPLPLYSFSLKELTSIERQIKVFSNYIKVPLTSMSNKISNCCLSNQ